MSRIPPGHFSLSGKSAAVELDAAYDRIANSNLNALFCFLRASGYAVARSAVWDMQERFLEGGVMSLGVAARVLEAMGVPFQACRYSKQAGIPAGTVALVPLRARRGVKLGPAEYSFAVATSLGPGRVPECRNGHGEALLLTAEQWRRQWNGIAIHVAGPPAGDRIADRAGLEAEQASAAAYAREIKFIENIVDPRLCEDIISYCEGRGTFRRSGVSEENIVSSVRTSHSVNLEGELAGQLGAQLKRHPMFETLAFEKFQVVRYRPGEQFMAHIDVSPEVRRPITAVLYLNDDFDGGATSFPSLGLEWSARKGCALVFRNLDEMDRPIEWSLHKAEKVNAGLKYACNIWTR
ncbi:MAG TPA: 2OG-Fe(II) oxygenase [Allosphingosinicella sp.]|nr:2OG-Fe(II) oxygenase [Allosphingosinicella sp.]